MKNLFIKEIQEIHNPELREACLVGAEKIPEYFWHIAASSSGKYHPQCDLGEGGLVRHSIMVCRCAIDLVRAEIFVPDTELNNDMARVAALFHDCLKQGASADGTGQTVFEHPLYAAKFVNIMLKDVKSLMSTDKSNISLAIFSHMGKWNRSKYSDTILPVPTSAFEKLIHCADYMASRKYIGGLEEWANYTSDAPCGADTMKRE